jgi:hypothetical protein
MTSQSDTQTTGEQRLRIDPGAQVLVSTDSLAPVVSQLPPSAYDHLLIVSTRTPAAVERAVSEAGGDVSKVGHIPLGSTPLNYDGPMWTGKRTDPSDLTGLSMQYTRALNALEADHGWVLFDRFNTLLVYNDEDRVVRFLNHLARRTGDADIRGVYTVFRGAMDDQTHAALANVVDDSRDVR